MPDLTQIIDTDVTMSISNLFNGWNLALHSVVEQLQANLIRANFAEENFHQFIHFAEGKLLISALLPPSLLQVKITTKLWDGFNLFAAKFRVSCVIKFSTKMKKERKKSAFWKCLRESHLFRREIKIHLEKLENPCCISTTMVITTQDKVPPTTATTPETLVGKVGLTAKTTFTELPRHVVRNNFGWKKSAQKQIECCFLWSLFSF